MGNPTGAGADRPRAHDRSRTGLHCSFCGKRQDEVSKIIAGPGVYICDECCALCASILAKEGSSAGGPGPEVTCRIAVRGADGGVQTWEVGPPPDDRHGVMVFAWCQACGTWNFGAFPLDAVNACLCCGADLGPKSFRGLAVGGGRFTERARQALTAAVEASALEGAPATGARHLLLALLRQDERSPARTLLRAVGADAEALAASVTPPAGATAGRKENPPFGPTAADLVRVDAPAHARILRHEHVGPEHLLLALCQDPETVPPLERAGVTQEALVRALRGLSERQDS